MKNAKERIKKGMYVLEERIYFTFSLYEHKKYLQKPETQTIIISETIIVKGHKSICKI